MNATEPATVSLDSPLGPIALVARDGALTALHLDPDGAEGVPGEAGAEPFAAAASQLGEYFAGRRTSFELPLAPAGTPFQLEVWSALRAIPYGETESYGELARRIGRPGASRAVGLANGRNPLAIIIPCHRVIGADGSLTGYGGGIERKRFLLDLERKVSGRTLC